MLGFIGDLIDSVVDVVVDIVSAIIDVVLEILSTILDVIVKVIKKIVDFVLESDFLRILLIIVAIVVVVALVVYAWPAIMSMWQSMTLWLYKAYTFISMEIIHFFSNGIVAAFASMGSLIWDAVTGTAAFIWSGLSKVWSGVKSIAGAMPPGLTDVIGDLIKGGGSVYLGSKLLDLLKDNLPLILGAVGIYLLFKNKSKDSGAEYVTFTTNEEGDLERGSLLDAPTWEYGNENPDDMSEITLI